MAQCGNLGQAQGKEGRANEQQCSLRRIAHNRSVSKAVPAQVAVSLLLLGDIMTAQGFGRNRLFVEYSLVFDPRVWTIFGARQPQRKAESSAAMLQVGASQC